MYEFGSASRSGMSLVISRFRVGSGLNPRFSEKCSSSAKNLLGLRKNRRITNSATWIALLSGDPPLDR